MIKLSWVLPCTVFFATCAVPASSQRPIELEVGASWQHPHSAIIVPSQLAGLPRGAATEYAPDFLNIGFSFRSDDPYEELSIYIYRHTNGGAPVWFEQARKAIEVRDLYAGAKLAFGVEQYGWPGAERWQGQRAIYDLASGGVAQSTAVALFSVNGWLIKMRASSASRSPGELAALMDEAFAELTPPEAANPQLPAIAVAQCDEKLKFKTAKDAKQDGASALLGALLGGIAAEKVAQDEGASLDPKPVVAWCRDSMLNPMQVVYRPDASTNSYMIALSDSGVSVLVGQDLSSQILAAGSKKSKPVYSISLVTDSQRISYVSQDRLPSPKRVLKIINDNRTTSSVSTWGDDQTIDLNSDAL